jgi:eukaryotic-like serine/threonine-protein kinase
VAVTASEPGGVAATPAPAGASPVLGDRVLDRLRETAAGPVAAGERYVLERELGRGGMGRVWLGVDTVLGREVAVKVLEAGRGRVALESRMREEARILAALEHPGIVPVHDLGRTADGRLFYVMKRVQGETLDAHLARVADRGERLRTFERLCEPVAFAHARGVIHRDLKPGNVMVGSFGEVLVMDWGVARVLADTAERRAAQGAEARPFDPSPRGTDPGTVLGTRGWMAPEQARGEPVDARADVWSLGAILLEIVTGAPRAPDADPRAALAAARGVPRPLAAIVARALAPERRDRYPSVAALAADVASFRDGRPVAAYRETPLERVARWARRHRTPIVLVAAYLVMRAAVALWIRQRAGP